MMLIPVPMMWHDHKSYVALHFHCLDPWSAVVPLMMSHDQKSHVAPHFSCLNLRNGKMSLMLLLALCGTDVNANGIKWPKSHAVPHFDCLDLNAMVSLPTPLTSHDANAGDSGVIWQKSHVAPHFNYCDLMNAVVHDNTFGITKMS